MPTVLNRLHDMIPPDAVNVARPSKWGNPFIIGLHGGRSKVLTHYAIWLDAMLFNGKLDPSELTDKDLVCFCAPLPCHADILLELANA